MFGIRDFVWYD